MRLRECHFCAAELVSTFADLGMSPASNSFIPAQQAGAAEPFIRCTPSSATIAGWCSWRNSRHRKRFSAIIFIFHRFRNLARPLPSACRRHDRPLEPAAVQVVELASNDGYLLNSSKIAACRFWAWIRRLTSPPKP